MIEKTARLLGYKIDKYGHTQHTISALISPDGHILLTFWSIERNKKGIDLVHKTVTEHMKAIYGVDCER